MNVARSEHCAALIVPPQLANSVQIERGDDAEPQTAAKPPRRGRLKEPPEAFVSVFLQFAPGEFDRIDLPPDLDAVTAVKGDSATAVLKSRRALALADNNRVAAIELGQPLRLPDPIAESTGRARTKASMDDASATHAGTETAKASSSASSTWVASTSPIRTSWSTAGPGSWRSGTRAARRARSPRLTVGSPSTTGPSSLRRTSTARSRPRPPVVCRPTCSSRSPRCPSDLARDARGPGRQRGLQARQDRRGHDLDPRGRPRTPPIVLRLDPLAHAVDYLLAVAEDEGLPISINISLGTNGHAHDDSSPVSRWIDAR